MILTDTQGKLLCGSSLVGSTKRPICRVFLMGATLLLAACEAHPLRNQNCTELGDGHKTSTVKP